MDVLPLDVAEFAQALAQFCPQRLSVCIVLKKYANTTHPVRLLRLRPERPCRRAAEQCDEVAPFHSITSSARTKIVSGMVIPRAFAVLRFTTSSNLAERSMGRSAGLVPPKIRPT